MTDRTLKERYRLDRKLGEGGMATVFAGTDALLRRRVAVKVLRPQFSADVDFVRRFYHEAESVARLSYPNIVSIYDVGHDGETYFIVMELVDGWTLAEMIESDGRLPEAVAVDYAEQICRALAYAHRHGILHRDVKPANILITKDDVVKLSDFGIARAVTTQTMTLTSPGMVMGSVYYLSPEQAQGHDVRETSDLYSLGVVLYQMLTGKLPYTGESPVTVALKHVSSPVPEIEESESISPMLTGIVRQLLQKDPADRFQSATETAAALRVVRDEQPPGEVAAGRTPPVRRLPPKPPPRRSPSPDRRMPEPPILDNGRLSALEHPGQRRPRALTLAVLAVLFIASVAAGYAWAARPGVFGGPLTITVPSVVGKSSADAQKLLTAAGLRSNVTVGPSATVARDRVVSQQPAAAAVVPSDTVAQLVVSNGLPMVSLIDLHSYSRDDAERYLRDAKLTPRIVENYDRSPRGTVLKQAPGPGTLAIKSIVTLTISKGPAPVMVPSVVTMTLDQATTALHQAGLTVQTERLANDNIPENVVASQSPESGNTEDRGSAVTLVVSSGPATIGVPDLSGRSVGDAIAALHEAGLSARVNYSLQPGGPVGTVLDETPAAGFQTKHGTTVVLTVVVSGIVPDVTGMSLDQARTALVNAGYNVGNVAYTQNGTEGKVASTEPQAGSTLRPGETVTIYFNGGVDATSAPSTPSAPQATPAGQ